MGLMTSRDSRNRLVVRWFCWIHSFVGFVGFVRTAERGRRNDGTTERRNDDATRRRGNAVPIYVDDDRGTTDATGGRRTGTGRATERRDTTFDDARS